MLRVLTAGESHGPELVAFMEGLPAGVPISRAAIQQDLARRKLGYGRGSRMKFEEDELTISAGVRHGFSIGSPIALRVGNTEWPKWTEVMSAEPVELTEMSRGRGAALTRPRPGHADLVGMQKYGFDEARPILERASARETAARVALGAIARSFLSELGIRLVSHTLSIGPVRVPDGAPLPTPDDVDALDADPLRCFDAETSAAMVTEVDAAKKDGDTLGGVVEVVVSGLPIGLGSFTSGDDRLDSQLAAAVMGIQAIKGVEIGDGFASIEQKGSEHGDEMTPQGFLSNHAGGVLGGISTGQDIVVHMAIKPTSSIRLPRHTVNLAGEPATVETHGRHDPCVGIRATPIAEAMLALVLIDHALRHRAQCGDVGAVTPRIP